jgi:hypothetical protein
LVWLDYRTYVAFQRLAMDRRERSLELKFALHFQPGVSVPVFWDEEEGIQIEEPANGLLVGVSFLA